MKSIGLGQIYLVYRGGKGPKLTVQNIFKQRQLLKFSWFSPEFHFNGKDLSRVKPAFKSVPPQFYFEIAGLASAVKWREIQNIDEEERF